MTYLPSASKAAKVERFFHVTTTWVRRRGEFIAGAVIIQIDGWDGCAYFFPFTPTQQINVYLNSCNT